MNRFSLFLFDLLKNRKTAYYLSEFEKIKCFSEKDILEYQLQKLKKLLIHAEKNVSFYRQRFKESGFSAKKFEDIEQIQKIPPLTRSDLQNHWKEMVADNYDEKKLSKGSSSGSSGLPVFYYQDNIATSAGQAAHLFGWSLSGWQMNMKGLHIWGNPSTVNIEWKRFSSRLKAKLFGHHKFPAYQLVDGGEFGTLYELIKKNKYEFLDGYTNAIYLFAEFLKKNNLSLSHIVKYVLPTAENLQDFQRHLIEETIAPVYDEYGCSEINGIAYECAHCKHYHVIDPHVYIEFGDRKDEFGAHELWITDLDNFAFPLIRYRNDDLGIPLTGNGDECPVKFSRIAGISGRESDIIRLKDGGTLSVPSFFGSMLLKQIDGLKQYQIEKIQEDLIIVNLATTHEFSTKEQKIVYSALEDYLSDRIKYKVKYVDSIASSETGKFKLLVDRTKQ